MRDVVQTLNEVRHAQFVMGTVVEIKAWGDESAREAVYRATREFERLEKMFSRFDPSSELSFVNGSAGARPVRVSKEFFDVVNAGIAYGDLSGGCFSITMGPVIQMWERCAAEDRLPGGLELQKAVELSRSNLVRLDGYESSVAFSADGVALDLGGLVKGYAVDCAIDTLKKGGIACAIVSAGTSSIRVINELDEEPFELGIRHPLVEYTSAATLSLDNQAVSTSGTYERRFTAQGQTFSHLVDPRDGSPLEGLASATAVCDSAILAEAASKILLFAGCERGSDICDKNNWNVQGITMTADDSRQVRLVHTAPLNVEV